MKLKVLAPNMTQIDNGKYRVLFSYETPVAAFDSSGTAFKTSQKFSATTSKHISKFLGTDAKSATEKPQSFFNSLTESKVSESIKESLGIEAACGFLDVMNSYNPIMESFDGDEDNPVNEESDEGDPEKKYWYTSSSGEIEFQMTLAQAESVSQPGKDAEEDVRNLMRDPDMKEVVEYLQDNMESVKKVLSGISDWDVSDEDMNIVRMIWIAGTDISENAFNDSSAEETYEELDLDNEDSDMHESNLNESSGGKDWEHEDVIDSRDIIERIEELEGDEDLDESEQEELAMLKSVAEEGEHFSDWEHGETLINTNYWVEYCKDLVSDVGDLPRDLPSYIAIDWEKTADNLSNDYSRIDVGNSEFYIRS